MVGVDLFAGRDPQWVFVPLVVIIIAIEEQIYVFGT